MTAEEAQLLTDLANAVGEEARARATIRACSARVTTLIGTLQARGIPSSKIAARVARAKGEPASPADRQRIASALRQRKARATRCHRNQIEPPYAPAPDEVLIPGKEADHMPTPKVVRRTTTTVEEEFLDEGTTETDESERDDETEGDDREPEDEAAEDRRPKRRRS